MVYPDFIPLLDDKHDHVRPSLITCRIGRQKSSFRNVVQYNIQPETLCTTLIGTNVKHVSTGKGSDEDSSTLIVSIANMEMTTLKTNVPLFHVELGDVLQQ